MALRHGKSSFSIRLVKERKSECIGPASLKKNNWIPLLNKGYVFIIQSNHVMRDTCKLEI